MTPHPIVHRTVWRRTSFVRVPAMLTGNGTAVSAAGFTLRYDQRNSPSTPRIATAYPMQ